MFYGAHFALDRGGAEPLKALTVTADPATDGEAQIQAGTLMGSASRAGHGRDTSRGVKGRAEATAGGG